MKIKDLNLKIKNISDYTNWTQPTPTSTTRRKIIPSFNDFIRQINEQRGVYLDGMNQYLKSEINFRDVIMIRNLMDIELDNLLNIKNFNQENLKKLLDIYPTYKHLSKLAQTYFENQNYLDDNKVLQFFKDVLIHLTQNILCYNIEMIMRKVLFNHFNSEDSMVDVTRNINYLLNFERMLDGNYTNMKEILYKVISEKIVMNSVDIFKNQTERDTFEFQTIDEILENYFDLLSISEVFPLSSNDYAMKVLKNEVVSYFNSICKNTIENWMVVMENQLKFIINQETNY